MTCHMPVAGNEWGSFTLHWALQPSIFRGCLATWKVAEAQEPPPPPHLRIHISGQDSGREGAPGGCPPGHECQLYNIRKGAEKSHCLCSHCTKGKKRRNTLECIPAAARKQSHSGHRGSAFRAIHLHRQMPQRLPHQRPHRLRCTQPPSCSLACI